MKPKMGAERRTTALRKTGGGAGQRAGVADMAAQRARAAYDALVALSGGDAARRPMSLKKLEELASLR